MSFLGVIAPDERGRWHWPFRAMMEGDWFLVDWEQRDPESVRNLAAVKGSQLGKSMRIEKRPADHPGFTKVMCVEPGAPRHNSVEGKGKRVNYELAGVMLDRYYGLDANRLAWTAMEEGQVQDMLAARSGEAERDVVEVALPPAWLFELSFMEDRVRLLCKRAPPRAPMPTGGVSLPLNPNPPIDEVMS